MRRSRPLALERLEDRCVPSTSEPVLLIPGLQGALPSSAGLSQFLDNLGDPPTQLAVTSFYLPLTQALQNAGYRFGSTLWTVPYDWRLPLAPGDGNPDGVLSGVTAASITDNVYQYCIDYVGYTLKQAAQAWILTHPGNPLTQVNVIAHSEGGLVARAYMESTAYGGTFVSDRGQMLPLPKIDKLIEMGTPNLGVSSAWQSWEGNWSDYVSFGGLSAALLNQYATVPYNTVVAGGTITSPFGNITLQSITNPATGQPDSTMFMRQYWPVEGQLSADYNFLMVNGRLTNANNLLGIYPIMTDLNGGPDPNAWAGLANSVSLIYGTADSTINYDLQRIGPPGQTYTIDGGATNVVAGQAWYLTLNIPNNGDEVVALQTSAQPYVNDARFAKYPQNSPSITHFTLVSDPGVLSLVVGLVTGPTTTARPPGAALLTAATPAGGARDLAWVELSRRGAIAAGRSEANPAGSAGRSVRRGTHWTAGAGDPSHIPAGRRENAATDVLSPASWLRALGSLEQGFFALE